VLALRLLKNLEVENVAGGWDLGGKWGFFFGPGALSRLEFGPKKFPAVDTAWDAIHTFIRVPAGAILAASAFADFDPAVKMAAMILGGGIALSSHGTKAATRLAVNASPEPVSNAVLSLTADVIAF